jgi:hypothetical protein
MTETAVKIIDHIRHEQIRPLQQSLKAHAELAKNESLHISPSVLKDIGKRVQDIENNILMLLNKEE